MIRRDPRALSGVLRGARAQAHPLGFARALAHDPSALLTVAGMHPLKPYFLGGRRRRRRVGRAVRSASHGDIDNVGNTDRHLTFFEMLGNFSIGDYFKAEAIALRWELSLEVFGFSPEESGSRRSRATISSASVRTRRRSSCGAPRECRASGSCPARARRTSGRRGPWGRVGRVRSCTWTAARTSASRATCRAARTNASWSTGTSCTCNTTRSPKNTPPNCPPRNIDMELGLDRMAAITAGQALGLRVRPVPAVDRPRRGAVGSAKASISNTDARGAFLLTTRAR